jgi:hypothetical protein
MMSRPLSFDPWISIISTVGTILTPEMLERARYDLRFVVVGLAASRAEVATPQKLPRQFRLPLAKKFMTGERV